MSSPATQPASYGRGAIIGGKYRLDSEIGEGGMATVWRATHLTLRRPVAVKFIHLRGPDPDAMRDRFLREARIAAAVRHRNVTDIIDFGATREGRPYMVMELLEGQSLAERMRGPAMSVPEVVRTLSRTLSGLAAAHEAGVVHRDLKPENIFLQRDSDGTIHPKLFDFGISRAVDDEGELKSVMQTDDSVMVGTPHYMSPEQARGLKDIDRRADLYAMGVILYELLAGELPHSHENVGDLLILIATEDPVPFARLRPDLGEPLAGVVRTAMARDRSARFQTAREMRQALLQAAAQTAESIVHRGRSTMPGVGTDSDAPVLQPKELLDAIGDSYEEGDSGVIHTGEMQLGGPATAWARGGAAPTMAEDPPSGAAPPRAPRRLWWIAAAAIVLAAAAGGVGLIASAGTSTSDGNAATETEVEIETATEAQIETATETETEVQAEHDTVEVSLTGVPAGATVLVDGEEHTGTDIELARGDATHRIAVRAEGFRTWSVEHTARGGARYEVELVRERSRARRGGPGGGADRRGSRGSSAQDTVFRDPGF